MAIYIRVTKQSLTDPSNKDSYISVLEDSLWTNEISNYWIQDLVLIQSGKIRIKLDGKSFILEEKPLQILTHDSSLYIIENLTVMQNLFTTSPTPNQQFNANSMVPHLGQDISQSNNIPFTSLSEYKLNFGDTFEVTDGATSNFERGVDGNKSFIKMTRYSGKHNSFLRKSFPLAPGYYKLFVTVRGNDINNNPKVFNPSEHPMNILFTIRNGTVENKAKFKGTLDIFNYEKKCLENLFC